MQRDRARDWAIRRVWAVSRPDRAGKRRPYFGDVAVAVWVVALIGMVALAGAVMVLALLSTTVPASSRIANPTFDGSAVTTSDEDGAVLVGDDWVYGPNMTR